MKTPSSLEIPRDPSTPNSLSWLTPPAPVPIGEADQRKAKRAKADTNKYAYAVDTYINRASYSSREKDS